MRRAVRRYLRPFQLPRRGDPKQVRRRAWLVWSVAASFLLAQFFLQLSSGEILGGLIHSFALSALGGGVLVSAYYYIYVTLQVPAGILMDRFGPRKLLSIGAVVVMLGCYLFGSAHYLWLAWVGRLMMGAGATFAFVGTMFLISRWFPKERFGVMVALVETIGTLGALFGGLSLAGVVEHYGWRTSMVGSAVIFAGIGLLSFLIIRDAPTSDAESPIPLTLPMMWCNLKILVKKKATWANALYSGFMYCVVTVFVALWGIPYLQLAHHLSLFMATLMADMVFLGVAIGSPIVGWMDIRLNRRRLILTLLSLVSAVLMSAIIFIPGLPFVLSIILMFVLGLTCSGYVITFSVANEIAVSSTHATSIGFTNAFCVGTAPIIQPLIGFILYLFNDHAIGAEHYTIAQYQWALSCIPLLVLVSAGLARYIPERAALSEI